MHITSFKTQSALLLISCFFICQCTALNSPDLVGETGYTYSIEGPKSISVEKATLKNQAQAILAQPIQEQGKQFEAFRQAPQKIALLLPLTGPLAGPGQAIKEGVMAAHKASGNSIEIKTYDTNKGLINETYQKAIDSGAQYVIGPLTKKEVAAVGALEHPVPTLLLNDTDGLLQDNAYLFGLSPTNEALEVAIKAAAKGYHDALVIAPQNEWGQEIAKAFTNQWVKQGNEVLGSVFYTQEDNLDQRINDLLEIKNSQLRQKQIKQVLGFHLESVASRRQDFDVVFLVAYPSIARQIMPLLKYYNATDVPIYATSSVYSGSANALRDKDLDGIVFCDIPWVFSHQMGVKNWPEQFNSYNRLYALGQNSFALATGTKHLSLSPKEDNKPGTFYLKPTKQVAQVLEWGQFKQGLAHSLGQLS